MPDTSIEILAPAGDQACLHAALEAGADAVYFGLQKFNARMRATNFEQQRLSAILDQIHRAGARGYVTVNTLVFDHELDDLRACLDACGEACVDAIIVQDLGVLSLARERIPSVPVHASTQMTATDESALAWVASLGVSRVILPRELSLQEIDRIRATTPLELEVFVHGALCVSFSGQCQASLALGGRSANRGACAQPCRLPYGLEVDGAQVAAVPYLLSPMDLDASPVVPRLLASGIRALKIEGRLKGPSYVGAVVRLYRGIVDAWRAGQPDPQPDPAHRGAALQMFSRGSGTAILEGIDHQTLIEGRSSDHRGVFAGVAAVPRWHRGKTLLTFDTQVSIAKGDGLLVEADGRREELGGRVWSILQGGRDVEMVEAGHQASVWLGPQRVIPEDIRGRRVFRTSAPRLEADLQRWLKQHPRRIPVRMELQGSLGQCPLLRGITSDGRTAEVTLDQPLVAAENHPLVESVVRAKLARLGDTPFVLDDLKIQLPARCMLPWSSLNDARRRLVEQLQRAPRERDPADDPLLARSTEARGSRPESLPAAIVVLCRTREQMEAALRARADAVVIDLPSRRDSLRELARLRAERVRCALGLATLRVRKPGDSSREQALVEAAPDLLLVRSLGALSLAARLPGAPAIVTDASIPVANAQALSLLLQHGARACTPSWDVDPAMLDLGQNHPLNELVEAIAYGHRPLFHTQHCLVASRLSSGHDKRTCGRPCDHHRLVLRDRVGAKHVVVVDEACRNTVFEHDAGNWQSRCAAWLERGVRRLRVELVDEGPEQVAAILERVRHLRPTPTVGAA